MPADYPLSAHLVTLPRVNYSGTTWRWEDTSGNHLVCSPLPTTPLAQRGDNYRRLLRAVSNLILSISKDEHLSTSFHNLFQCLITLRVKKCFLKCKPNFPYFNLCPLPLLSVGTTEKSVALPSYSSIRYLLYIDQIPLSLVLLFEQSQLSQALLVYQMLQAFTNLHGRSWGLLQYVQVSL